MRSETIAVHGGFTDDPATKAIAVPIYQNVAFSFDSADHGAALFNLEADGFRYSRISNPTVAVLERRIAALHGAVGTLAVASGQAALNLAFLCLADGGDGTIVSVPLLYGTTHTLLAHVLPRQGIRCRFAATDRAADLEPLIDRNTRAIFCETVGNPAGNVVDLRALADLAQRHGLPLVVDNTVATPILLRPMDHGADIVVESLTKSMGGHGAVMGGAISDVGRFNWADAAARFPAMVQPDASYHGISYAKRFGPSAYVERCRSVYQRTTGAVLAPMRAFLLIQGIETVALRVQRQVENARDVATFLAQDERVEWVQYAGFAGSQYYQAVQDYLGGRAPSLLTFGVRGGLEAGKRFYDALRLIKRVVNIGDAKSLACHPASTTHRQMNAAEQRAAGVAPETIRLSVGIEHIDDILADLDHALASAEPRSGHT